MYKLALIGLVIWGSVVFNGFVGDDIGYVYHPYIQKMEIAKLFVGSSSDLGGSSPITGQFYRPLMLLLLTWLYKIFGLNAWGYHVFQVSLAIVNGYLVYFLFRKKLNKNLSLILATIFLIHPINAETVLYISNLQDVLMMMFGMTALLAMSNGLWVISLLLLSLLAKETGIIFVVFYIFLYKNRWKNVLGVLPVYLLIRWLAGVKMGTGLGSLGWPSLEVGWYYLKTFLWPMNLAIGQVWSEKVISFQWSVVGWFISLLVVSLLWRIQKLQFWLGWIVVSLLPHLQIIPLEMTVADRWAYSLSIGFIGLFGSIGNNWKNWVWGLILVLLAGRSLIRVRDFRNNLTLLSHDRKITDSYLLEQSLGFYLMEAKRMDEAKTALEKSIRLKENTINTNSIGVYYFRLGDTKKAINYFRRSTELGDNFQAYNNLARLLIAEENWPEARLVISAGQKKFPQSKVFWDLEKYLLENKSRL